MKTIVTSKDIANFYLLVHNANDSLLEQLSYKIGQEIRKRHALKGTIGKSTYALNIFNKLEKRTEWKRD